MAYVSKEDKAEIQPIVKSVLKKYNLKGTLRVRNYSTLILTLRSGAIDFLKEYNKAEDVPNDNKDARVNVFWISRDYTGVAKEALEELAAALKGPRYFDESDAMTDYFHCSH